MAFSALPQSPAVNLQDAPWLSPADAFARVQAVVGDRRVASDTLVGRLKAGLLRASYQRASLEGSDDTLNLKTDSVIDAKFWSYYDASSNAYYVWSAGDLRLYLGNYFKNYHDARVYLTFFGVKIEAKGIDEIVANTAPPAPKRSVWIKKPPDAAATPPTPEPQVKTNLGGAPRKDWWDDFWIEICRQIWVGDLQPRTQAELAEAMHQWVENHHGGDVGETTIKAAARKLFKAWNLGSKT